MAQKFPASTCRKAEPRLSLWKKTVLTLRGVFYSGAQVRRFGIWLAIALAVTTGMGAVANRLVRELAPDVPTAKLKEKPKQTNNWDSGHAAWWEPSASPAANDAPPAPAVIPAKTTPASAQTSPASVPAIPVDRGFQNPPSVALNNQLAPIGLKPTQTNFSNPRWIGSAVGARMVAAGRSSGNPTSNRNTEKVQKALSDAKTAAAKNAADIEDTTIAWGREALQKEGRKALRSDAPSVGAEAPQGMAGRSNGHLVIPVEDRTQFSYGSLSLGGPSSGEAYAILGLRTSSSPSAAAPGATVTPLAGSELSFSLSGDLGLVPTDNLAASGLGFAVIAIPEPSTASMLAAAGLAGLAFARRRTPAKCVTL